MMAFKMLDSLPDIFRSTEFGIIIGIVSVLATLIAWRRPKELGISDKIPPIAHQEQSPHNSNTSSKRSVSKSKSELAPGIIPDGVTLGDKVVVVPGVMSMPFSHSGYMTRDLLKPRLFSWIKRGDVIGRYNLVVWKSSSPWLKGILGNSIHSCSIHAPVSGLIIKDYYGFCMGWKRTAVLNYGSIPFSLSILIPNDESPAEDGEQMFIQLKHLCIDYKKEFFQPSGLWTIDALDPEYFFNAIEEQQKRECFYADAMPYFEDKLGEARTEYPSLRPHLKHLVPSRV